MPMSFPRRRAALVIGLLSVALLAACGAGASEEPAPDAYSVMSGAELQGGIMEGALADHIQDPFLRTQMSQTIATAYIIGVADAGNGTTWCPPGTLAIQQTLGPVLDHLTEVPEEVRQRPAPELVLEALAKAHPCAADADSAPDA